jgi:amidase
LTGHPTVTLPGGFSDEEMPIGFQLAGRDEGTLIRAGMAFQSITNWHRRHPALLAQSASIVGEHYASASEGGQ